MLPFQGGRQLPLTHIFWSCWDAARGNGVEGLTLLGGSDHRWRTRLARQPLGAEWRDNGACR